MVVLKVANLAAPKVANLVAWKAVHLAARWVE